MRGVDPHLHLGPAAAHSSQVFMSPLEPPSRGRASRRLPLAAAPPRCTTLSSWARHSTCLPPVPPGLSQLHLNIGNRGPGGASTHSTQVLSFAASGPGSVNTTCRRCHSTAPFPASLVSSTWASNGHPSSTIHTRILVSPQQTSSSRRPAPQDLTPVQVLSPNPGGAPFG